MFKKPMDSFLRNFVREFRGSCAVANPTLVDTGGTSRGLVTTSVLGINAPEGNHDYGILLGTGTNAVSCLDNALQTKISHGNAADQLYHMAIGISIVTESASNAYFTTYRNFNNNSGATITVQEVALVARETVSSWNFIYARDLTGAIEVLNGKTLVAQYTFKVTA